MDLTDTLPTLPEDRWGPPQWTLLRAALERLGYPTGAFPGPPPQWRRSLRILQAAHGIPATGRYDEETAAALRRSLKVSSALRHRASSPRPWSAASDEPVVGLYRGDSFRGRVVLTFDDGPDAVHTPRILDQLDKAGVTATFYVQGHKVEAHRSLLARMVDAGHRIGNHSWDHPRYPDLSDEEVCEQIVRTDAALAGLPTTSFLRPPYGEPFFTPGTEAWHRIGSVIQGCHKQLIMWQIDTWDWKHPDDPVSVVAHMRDGLARHGGGVVLFHDTHAQTAAALPGVFDLLRRSTLEIVDEVTLLNEKYPTSP